MPTLIGQGGLLGVRFGRMVPHPCPDCCGKAFYRATLCPLDASRCYDWPAPPQEAYIATDFAPPPGYTGTIKSAGGCYQIDFGTVLSPCDGSGTAPCVPTGASIITEYSQETGCDDPDCQPGSVPGVVGPGAPCWGDYSGPPVFIASVAADVPRCFVVAVEVPMLCNGVTQTVPVCFKFDKQQRVCAAPEGSIVRAPVALSETSSSCCACSSGCSQETSVTGQYLNTTTNSMVNQEIGPCCCRTGQEPCNGLIIQGSSYERLQGTYVRQEGATVIVDEIVERRYFMQDRVPMIETRVRRVETYDGTVVENRDTTSLDFYNPTFVCPPSLAWNFARIAGDTNSGDCKWDVAGSYAQQCNRVDLGITATRTLSYRPAPPESGFNCIEWGCAAPTGFLCSAVETYVATGTLIVTTVRPCETLACPDAFLVAAGARDEFEGQWA